jgi:ubiquinone/menaquinone biosynthesis C-methylase UbiE
MKLPRRRLPLLALLLPLFSCSCEGVRPVQHSRPLTPPPEEVSAKPGINDEFLGDDVDVKEWFQKFETEAREIAAHRDAIVAALELRKGQDVADVGSGTGLFLEPLAQTVGVGGRVYALDIAPKFVEALRQRVQHLGLEQVEVRLSKERSVELPALSLDAAFVCDTYHHFEYPQHVLFSLFKAIRPLGYLYVVDFEKVPGVSREWVMDHVRADKKTTIKEIEQAGFEFVEEIPVPELQENYLLRFRRP